MIVIIYKSFNKSFNKIILKKILKNDVKIGFFDGLHLG